MIDFTCKFAASPWERLPLSAENEPIMPEQPAYVPNPARSALMARIGGRDTGPELRVRRFLHARGLRYSLHDRHLTGRPDIVFRCRRIAVFVHGCFWHRHPGCSATRTPKTRLEFWEPKFRANVARDEQVRSALTEQGWRVIVIWECETTTEDALLSLTCAIKSARADDARDTLSYGRKRARR